MTTRKTMLAAGLVVVAALAMASSAGATAGPQRTAYLTFSGPFQVPGKVLGPGTYTFEVMDPSNLVRVSSGNRTTVYLISFTRLVNRPAHMRQDGPVSFGEASTRTPPPLKVWYPQNDSKGREFIY